MKLKPYANVVEEVTTGLRMPEELARQIAEAGKGLPKDFTFRRVAKAAAEFQLEPGSRSDVSIVTTDAVDHQKEVVLPGGLDFAVFRSNPVVPFAHDYDTLPVGKCVWIKASGNGVAAMTKYAKCPPNHTDWLPDAILSLMQEGMCTGKSIGFIPTHVRSPTSDEVARRPELKGAQCVIDRSTLLEFSVAPVPCNPEAIAVAVSKSFGNTATAAAIVAAAKAFAVDADDEVEFEAVAAAAIEQVAEAVQAEPPEITAPFVTPQTLAAYRRRVLNQLPARVESEARAKFANALDRLRGRV